MKTFQNVAVLVATLTLGAIVTDAQPARQNAPGRGRGAGDAYSRIYNPETVETIKGQVESVDKMSPTAGMGQGIPDRQNRFRRYPGASWAFLVHGTSGHPNRTER